MKSYRKFTTVGEQRAKQQDRKQTIGCFLILIVACVLLPDCFICYLRMRHYWKVQPCAASATANLC